MLPAIEIILERLKTHPEEFVTFDGTCSNGKWYPLIEFMKSWATDEEQKIVNDALNEGRRELANQVALKILSGEYYEPDPRQELFYQHPYNTAGQAYKTKLVVEVNKLKSAGLHK
jgi:hypothetical protein